MKSITRLLIFTFLLSSTITLAQPGREKVEEYELNNKSLFDLANHFNNYLGVLFEEGELSELSKAVSQLDSLSHFVGVNSGYSLLSLVQTRNQAILESSLTNDNIFLSGFVSDKQGGVGLDFYAYIDNTLFSDQENETYSSFIEEEIQRYYNSQLRRVKSAPDAIAYGMGVYLDILLGRNDLAPSYLDGGEPDVGQGIETFKNKQPKTISPYIYFEEETTFMGLAGIPIPLPANAFVTFYPVGHKYEGCLRSFTLDREINATNGTDERGVYKPLTYTSSTPYFGKFAGYGYRILPEGMGVNSAKFKRYSYEEFVQPQETIGLPTYSEGKVINVTRGIVYSCVEGRTSAKYSTKTNNYVITVEDVSDPSINPDYEYVHDRLSYLGVNDFMTAQVIFEGYSASTTTWDNILNQAVSVDQSHDGAGSYSCIVDSLGNETHIKAAIESGQSYITKLRDGSIAIIAVVGGKQYFVYQPFDDQQGAEYMIYHESAGWVDIDVIHDNTVNDFVNAMVYVGETIAIASFIVANIVIGNEVAAGMAIAGYCSSSIVAATVGIDLAFGVAEGGVVLFLTDDPDKAKTAFLVAAGAAIVGGGLEVLAQRAVKSFSKFRFGRQLGEATEGFDAIIKIRRADGTEISRSLRQFTNDLKLDGFSEARIKILFDEMNGNAKLTNFVLSAEGLNGAKAWDVLASSNKEAARLLRTDVGKLEDLSRFITNNPNDISRIISELNLPNIHVGQYLDYVKHVGTDLEHFYATFRLYTDPQGRSWQEFLSWINNSNKFKVGLPSYQGKTYEEVVDIVLQSDRYSHMTRSDGLIAFSYTTPYFYKTVNGWIMAGEKIVLSQQIMAGVLPSLAKLPKFEPNTVFYRAIEVQPDNLPAFLAEYVDGADVSKDFIQSIATREADTFIGRPYHNIEFEIKGLTSSLSEARDIHDFAWGKYWKGDGIYFIPTLSEGVLMAGTNLRVVGLQSEVNGIYRFILEEF